MGNFLIENDVLLKYLGNEESVTIPDEIKTIGKCAFFRCTELKSVDLNNVTKIEELAFFGCTNLNEVIGLNGLSEESESAFELCSMLKRDFFTLDLKHVEELCGKDFYIKAYQRGYRWTETEVKELLEDIFELYNTKEGDYCVQPLVVKTCIADKIKYLISNGEGEDYTSSESPEVYELIDGQQRLTTIMLILSHLGSNSYNIYYELKRGVDTNFINNAKETIKKWFQKGNHKKIDTNKFVSTIKNRIFFIWYEMNDNATASAESTFRKVNDGQIALTNAELFKAFLLNPENASGYGDYYSEVSRSIYQMAFEWDKLENDLWQKDFWYFISNDTGEEKTHLDYLFELYARSIDSKGYVPDLDRFSFLVIKEHLKGESFDKLRDVWNDIKSRYDKLYTWYDNYELYHYIGFLVACEGKSNSYSVVPDVISDLYTKHKDSSLDVVLQDVKNRVYESLKPQIEKDKKLNYNSSTYYGDFSAKEIKAFLLFINIYSIIKQNKLDIRFSFNNYKNTTKLSSGELVSWDVEHINSRSLLADISELDDEKLNKWLEYWVKEERAKSNKAICQAVEEYKNDKSPANKKAINDLWKEYARGQEEDNEISNLVLLDSETNRGYQNALFFTKRDCIIERDTKGMFILPCTKNLFLKYYTSDPDLSVGYNENDKTGYKALIDECVEMVKGFKK